MTSPSISWEPGWVFVSFIATFVGFYTSALGASFRTGSRGWRNMVYMMVTAFGGYTTAVWSSNVFLACASHVGYSSVWWSISIIVPTLFVMAGVVLFDTDRSSPRTIALSMLLVASGYFAGPHLINVSMIHNHTIVPAYVVLSVIVPLSIVIVGSALVQHFCIRKNGVNAYKWATFWIVVTNSCATFIMNLFARLSVHFDHSATASSSSHSDVHTVSGSEAKVTAIVVFCVAVTIMLVLCAMAWEWFVQSQLIEETLVLSVLLMDKQGRILVTQSDTLPCVQLDDYVGTTFGALNRDFLTLVAASFTLTTVTSVLERLQALIDGDSQNASLINANTINGDESGRRGPLRRDLSRATLSRHRLLRNFYEKVCFLSGQLRLQPYELGVMYDQPLLLHDVSATMLVLTNVCRDDALVSRVTSTGRFRWAARRHALRVFEGIYEVADEQAWVDHAFHFHYATTASPSFLSSLSSSSTAAAAARKTKSNTTEMEVVVMKNDEYEDSILSTPRRLFSRRIAMDNGDARAMKREPQGGVYVGLLYCQVTAAGLSILTMSSCRHQIPMVKLECSDDGVSADEYKWLHHLCTEPGNHELNLCAQEHKERVDEAGRVAAVTSQLPPVDVFQHQFLRGVSALASLVGSDEQLTIASLAHESVVFLPSVNTATTGTVVTELVPPSSRRSSQPEMSSSTSTSRHRQQEQHSRPSSIRKANQHTSCDDEANLIIVPSQRRLGRNGTWTNGIRSSSYSRKKAMDTSDTNHDTNSNNNNNNKNVTVILFLHTSMRNTHGEPPNGYKSHMSFVPHTTFDAAHRRYLGPPPRAPICGNFANIPAQLMRSRHVTQYNGNWLHHVLKTRANSIKAPIKRVSTAPQMALPSVVGDSENTVDNDNISTSSSSSSSDDEDGGHERVMTATTPYMQSNNPLLVAAASIRTIERDPLLQHHGRRHRRRIGLDNNNNNNANPIIRRATLMNSFLTTTTSNAAPSTLAAHPLAAPRRPRPFYRHLASSDPFMGGGGDGGNMSSGKIFPLT